jgi:hypothetical protein
MVGGISTHTPIAPRTSERMKDFACGCILKKRLPCELLDPLTVDVLLGIRQGRQRVGDGP